MFLLFFLFIVFNNYFYSEALKTNASSFLVTVPAGVHQLMSEAASPLHLFLLFLCTNADAIFIAMRRYFYYFL